MCGRTACTLCREDLQKACSYKDKSTGKYVQVKWGTESKKEYTPSYNIAPSEVTPVLVPGSRFKDEAERILEPMLWGMIPPWHKGEDNAHGMTTNNCRVEGLLNSQMYSKPYHQGNRCVIVCNGFYEWQTKCGKGYKQPYFIYSKQEEGVRVQDVSSWVNEWDEDVGWKGPKLLFMAGLYDVWTSPKGRKVYSYSVITMDSTDKLSWLHHRMPAILGEESIVDWLDTERVSASRAVSLINPFDSLEWHPVSHIVNNSRNKVPECVQRIDPENHSGSSLLMQNWLKGGTMKRPAPANEGGTKITSCLVKKVKQEDIESIDLGDDSDEQIVTIDDD